MAGRFLEAQQLADLPARLRHWAFAFGSSGFMVAHIFLCDVVEMNDSVLDLGLLCLWSSSSPPLAVLVLYYLSIGIGHARSGTRKDVRQGHHKEARKDCRREEGGGHSRPGVKMRRWHDEDRAGGGGGGGYTKEFLQAVSEPSMMRGQLVGRTGNSSSKLPPPHAEPSRGKFDAMRRGVAWRGVT